MKRYLQSGEREVEVQIEMVSDRIEVQIDGRCYSIDAVPAGPLRSLIVDGKQYETSALSQGNGSYLVHAGDFEGEVTVLDPLEKLAGGRNGAGARGSHKVTAYMPGRVVSLLVAQGDQVESGQGILVLEAMKMENEIQAETSGVVKQFFVEAGQAVESGDPLFELE